MMAAMRHPNIVLYLGVCSDPPCVVTEYCARGSLNDVFKRALLNPLYATHLDWCKRCAPGPEQSCVLWLSYYCGHSFGTGFAAQHRLLPCVEAGIALTLG